AGAQPRLVLAPEAGGKSAAAVRPENGGGQANGKLDRSVARCGVAGGRSLDRAAFVQRRRCVFGGRLVAVCGTVHRQPDDRFGGAAPRSCLPSQSPVAVLLKHMGEFVRQQPASGGGLRIVLAGREIDVASMREGARI